MELVPDTKANKVHSPRSVMLATDAPGSRLEVMGRLSQIDGAAAIFSDLEPLVLPILEDLQQSNLVCSLTP
jgi:hypothetical protein